MNAQGLRATAIELDRGEVEPPGYVREQLELQEGPTSSCWNACAVSRTSPLSLHRVWLPLWLAPELARRSINGASLYATLEQDLGVRLSSARQRITAVAATEREAELLKVARGAPLLFTERLTRDDNNRPVEFVESWSTPRLPLWIELHR